MLIVTITVKRRVVEYGTYDIEVPDEATPEQIKELAEERFAESDPENMLGEDYGESEMVAIEVEGVPLDEYDPADFDC